jgi:hypothetical protein
LPGQQVADDQLTLFGHKTLSLVRR